MSMRQPQDPLRQSPEQQRKRQAWWPVYGFFLTLAAGGVAFGLAPEVGRLTHEAIRPPFILDHWRIGVGIVIFVMFMGIIGALFAFMIPRPDASRIRDRELDRERKLMQAEALVKTRRQRELNKQMAEARKKEQEARERGGKR
jgi:hypothetical protein